MFIESQLSGIFVNFQINVLGIGELGINNKFESVFMDDTYS